MVLQKKISKAQKQTSTKFLSKVSKDTVVLVKENTGEQRKKSEWSSCFFFLFSQFTYGLYEKEKEKQVVRCFQKIVA